MKILEWLTSFFAWLEIVLSPLFFGMIGGLIIYAILPSQAGLVIGLVVASIGLIVGIVFATKVWKKRGTVDFISRVSKSPELDDDSFDQI